MLQLEKVFSAISFSRVSTYLFSEKSEEQGFEDKLISCFKERQKCDKKKNARKLTRVFFQNKM